LFLFVGMKTLPTVSNFLAEGVFSLRWYTDLLPRSLGKESPFFFFYMGRLVFFFSKMERQPARAKFPFSGPCTHSSVAEELLVRETPSAMGAFPSLPQNPGLVPNAKMKIFSGFSRREYLPSAATFREQAPFTKYEYFSPPPEAAIRHLLEFLNEPLSTGSPPPFSRCDNSSL